MFFAVGCLAGNRDHNRLEGKTFRFFARDLQHFFFEFMKFDSYFTNFLFSASNISIVTRFELFFVVISSKFRFFDFCSKEGKENDHYYLCKILPRSISITFSL